MQAKKCVCLLTLSVLCLSVRRIDCSQDAMKQIARSFLKVLEDCKVEQSLSDNILADLYNFWKENYALLNRDTGCAIMCMSKKLELIDDNNNKMHHGNAKEFASRHGADEDTANQLVKLLHDCETKQDGIEDDCTRVLEISKCFRTGIHELKWTPQIEVILSEVITDI